jgi:hypothetical protein
MVKPILLLATCFVISGCNALTSQQTIRLSPESVSDTVTPTSGFVTIGTAGTGNADADGDTSTCIDFGTAGTRTVRFAASELKTARLNVATSLQEADGSAQNGAVSISYSIDGGSSFVNVWTATGTQGRAQTTDEITLPNGQRTESIEVQYSAAMPPLHFKVCEAWIEGK